MAVDLQQELPFLVQELTGPLPANWAAPLSRFDEAMQHYLEYQVALKTGEVAVITLGRQESFLTEIEAYLQELDIAEESLAVFKSMRRYTGQATWGLKLSLSDQPEVQVYVKKPLPVAEVLFWLRQRQAIDSNAMSKVTAIAAILDKSHTHFVGADFTPGQPVRYQIYFTQYLEKTNPVADRVRQVMAELPLPTTAIEQFDRYHPVLAQPEQTLWLSVGLAGGALAPSMKLDYSGIRLGVVGLLLEELPLAQPQLDRLEKIGKALGIDTADYMGLRLKVDRPPELSVYLTRVRA